MALECPRCRTLNPGLAKFCRQCGLRLVVDGGRVLGAGVAPHPEPLKPGGESWPIAGGADLHFTWQVAGGGKALLGTEPLELNVFNGGHSLVEVALRIDGYNERGRPVLSVERELEKWIRGQSVTLEIASWELPGPVSALRVSLVRAEFLRDE